MDKEVGERMIRVCQSLIKMLELSFQGFRKHSEEALKEVEKVKDEIRKNSSELAHFLILKSSPCCCIKFGAQIHQTFGYQGTTLKSMSSAGLIKW